MVERKSAQGEVPGLVGGAGSAMATSKPAPAKDIAAARPALPPQEMNMSAISGVWGLTVEG